MTGPKIKNGAVTGAKVAPGSLTGVQIDSSTLGQVPAAASAETAGHATSADSATTAMSAGKATSADHATSATSATTATTATNAKELGEHEPSTYLPRVAIASATAEGTSIASGTASTVTPGGPLAITVPEGVSNVLAQGSISFSQPGGSVDTIVWVAESPTTCANGAALGFQHRAFGFVGSGTPRDEAVTDVVFPVTPGAHSYLLCAEAFGGGAELLYRNLVVQTVAAGPTG